METILATSATCGPCQLVKQFIKERNINVTIKDFADDPDFFREHGIRSVPVLLIKHDNGVIRYNGAPDIMNYFKEE